MKTMKMISIEIKQAEWIKDNNINLSKLVRNALDVEMATE